MTRYFGKIGYGENVESPPGSGVWKDHIVERTIFGDVERNTRQTREGDHLNADITVNNTISVVADSYANQHIFAIRFIEWAGALWTVTNVDVQRPRLILTLGVIYNGPRANAFA